MVAYYGGIVTEVLREVCFLLLSCTRPTIRKTKKPVFSLWFVFPRRIKDKTKLANEIRLRDCLLTEKSLMGFGTAWGGRLPCKEDIRWVQIPRGPPSIFIVY